MLVVMTDVDREDSFEVTSIHDQDPVETLATYGADPPFDERVRAGCPYRRADRPDALGAEHLVERRRELAVAPLGYTFLALALEVLALLQVLRLVRIMREVTHDMSREMSHGSTVRVWQRIRRRVRAGGRQTDLADKFGVNRKTIRRRLDARTPALRVAGALRADAKVLVCVNNI